MTRPKLAFACLGAIAVPCIASLWAAPARACGGFFCSQAAPVNQQAEEIVFVDHGNDSVTAIVRIQYVGPSESFAWLLPMPGVPEVGVSANVAFDRLRTATDPSYRLEVTVEGQCDVEPVPTFMGGFAPTDGAPSTPPTPTAPPPVTVLDQGSVGPYDYVTIALDPGLADPADVAVNWLVDNGYDVTSVGPDLLRPYLADGLNLIAFKLTKGNSAGAIRPVVLKYQAPLPTIPIRPTAVAAENDMGIRVWVVGDSQSVPFNYRSLIPNEALINWFSWRSNYEAVVTEAANQAGGQGFVTELAEASSALDEIVYAASDEQQWQQYQARTFVDGFDAIMQASSLYRSWDGWREAVCGDAVALPLGVTCDQFGQTPDLYRAQVAIDTTAFLTDLYDNVVKPVVETQELLLSGSYLTRLFSTMSADEMTVDPVFDFNPDLADVSNEHVAYQTIECGPGLYQQEAPWRIELPQGGVIRGSGQLWPVALDEQPANYKIVQLSTEGAGEIVEDNTAMISGALFEQSGMTPTGIATPVSPSEGLPIGGEPTGTRSEGSGGGMFGCSLAPPGAGTSLPALVLLALVALARNRRR